MAEHKTFAELKAHYLAVKKRLGGLSGATGVVPLDRIYKQGTPAPVESLFDFNGKDSEFVNLLKNVAAMHNMDPKIIFTARNRAVVKVRQEIQYLARTELKLSYPVIARLTKRDHKTVIYGVRQHAKMLANRVI